MQIFFKKIFLYFYIMCFLYFACMYVSVTVLCLVLTETREGVRSAGTTVTEGNCTGD